MVTVTPRTESCHDERNSPTSFVFNPKCVRHKKGKHNGNRNNAMPSTDRRFSRAYHSKMSSIKFGRRLSPRVAFFHLARHASESIYYPSIIFYRPFQCLTCI
jgi:hypothetical protein